jgi:hypothetical protein
LRQAFSDRHRRSSRDAQFVQPPGIDDRQQLLHLGDQRDLSELSARPELLVVRTHRRIPPRRQIGAMALRIRLAYELHAEVLTDALACGDEAPAASFDMRAQ